MAETILGAVKEVFTGKPAEQTAPDGVTAAVEAALPAAIAPMTHPEPANDIEPVAAVQAFSLTGRAHEILKTTLSALKVTKLGTVEPQPYPVAGVELVQRGFGGRHHGIMIGGSDEVQHGEPASLEVTLSAPANDHDVVALKNALPSLLETIPALAGKLKVKEAHITAPSYADVEAEFEKLAAEHPDAIAPQKQAAIKQFFEAHKGQEDRPAYWGNIRAMHHEGIVSIHIDGEEPSQAAGHEPKVSSDALQVDSLTAKQALIMDDFKARIEALKVEGVTAETLKDLDVHIAAQGWNIELKMGTKPTKLTDDEGKPLTGHAYAKAMGETPLDKIDTDMLQKLFVESLLAVNKETLDPNLAKLFDGPMWGHYLREQSPGNAAIAAFLDKHDLFKDQAQVKAEEKKDAAEHKIVLEEARIGRTFDEKTDKIMLDFELPPGMTLQQVLAGIVSPPAAEAALPKTQATPDTVVSEKQKQGPLQAANENGIDEAHGRGVA